MNTTHFINITSFDIHSEEESYKPSGSWNFSRIDDEILQIILSDNNNDINSNIIPNQVRAYPINYNTLRIMSGMDGIDFLI